MLSTKLSLKVEKNKIKGKKSMSFNQNSASKVCNTMVNFYLILLIERKRKVILVLAKAPVTPCLTFYQALLIFLAGMFFFKTPVMYNRNFIIIGLP